MRPRFEDYEALERSRAEGEIAMRRIVETKRRRTRMEHRQRRARSIWLVTLFLWASFLLFLILMLPHPASAAEPDPEPVTYHAPIGPELPKEEDLTEELEDFENEKIEAALLAKATRLDDVTVTWYTADTCGKSKDDPAYGITRSGLPVVEHQTCAVDPSVIPLYSDVYVQYADGSIEQLWATDTGVRGKSLDIYTPDYDYAIQCGRQTLTVWYIEGGAGE